MNPFAHRILADRQGAGVTFDAFRGCTKSKQRRVMEAN